MSIPSRLFAVAILLALVLPAGSDGINNPVVGAVAFSSIDAGGATTITNGVTNQLLYDNAGAVGMVPKGNSCIYLTNGTGVPSCSTTLPAVSGVSLALTGSASGNGFTAVGTKPTLTGSCAVVAGTQVGGATIGSFAVPAGNCATTTTVIVSMPTAANGWSCDAHDLTTPTSIWDQTATAAATVTFTIRAVNAVAADVVVFKCLGY